MVNRDPAHGPKPFFEEFNRARPIGSQIYEALRRHIVLEDLKTTRTQQ